MNSSIVDPAKRTHNAVPTRKRVRRMASRARSDAKHVPQKKTCFRHRVQRRFRSFGIGQLCGDAEDVRETLSMTGTVREQFIGASDCLGRGRNVRLSAWGESDTMKQEDCNEDRANRDYPDDYDGEARHPRDANHCGVNPSQARRGLKPDQNNAA